MASTELAQTTWLAKLKFLQRLRTLRGQQLLAAYLVMLPLVVSYGLFFVYPFMRAIYMSMTDYRLIAKEKPFIGLQNYQELFANPKWWKSVANTAEYTVLAVPAVLVLGLVIALLLNNIGRGRGFYRAIYFAPVITSGVAVAILWRYMMNPQIGLLNAILRGLGLPGSKWNLGATTVIPSIAMVAVWQSVGYHMILFLAGLQGIPPHFYDAAKVDGANRWQCFRHITLPLLQHTLLFEIVTSVIGSFQIFTMAALLGGQVPRAGGSVIVTFIYGWGLTMGYMGFASAGALVLFIVILIFSLVQLRMGRVRWQY